MLVHESTDCRQFWHTVILQTNSMIDCGCFHFLFVINGGLNTRQQRCVLSGIPHKSRNLAKMRNRIIETKVRVQTETCG